MRPPNVFQFTEVVLREILDSIENRVTNGSFKTSYGMNYEWVYFEGEIKFRPITAQERKEFYHC